MILVMSFVIRLGFPMTLESNFLAAAKALDLSMNKQSFRRTTEPQVNTAQAESIVIAVALTGC